MLDFEIQKGDVIFVNNTTSIQMHGIQHGRRPYVVVSNNKFNEHAPCVNAVPLTTRKCKKTPSHVLIYKTSGIKFTSIALCEQITTIPKELVEDKVCTLPELVMDKIMNCISFQLDL